MQFLVKHLRPFYQLYILIVWSLILVQMKVIYFVISTPPRNRGGVIFSFQFVCVYLCESVFVNEQIPAIMDAPFWMQFFSKWLLTALARTQHQEFYYQINIFKKC